MALLWDPNKVYSCSIVILEKAMSAGALDSIGCHQDTGLSHQA